MKVNKVAVCLLSTTLVSQIVSSPFTAHAVTNDAANLLRETINEEQADTNSSSTDEANATVGSTLEALEPFATKNEKNASNETVHSGGTTQSSKTQQQDEVVTEDEVPIPEIAEVAYHGTFTEAINDTSVTSNSEPTTRENDAQSDTASLVSGHSESTSQPPSDAELIHKMIKAQTSSKAQPSSAQVSQSESTSQGGEAVSEASSTPSDEVLINKIKTAAAYESDLPAHSSTYNQAGPNDEVLIRKLQSSREDDMPEVTEAPRLSHQHQANEQLPSTEDEQHHPVQSVDPTDTESQTTQRSTMVFQQPNLTDAADESDSYQVVDSEATRKFIKKVAKDAHDIGQQQELYASVIIAQAILESNSGQSELAQNPYHNLFGVKGAYQGQTAHFDTLEADENGALYSINAGFKQYPNHKASLEDYAQLMKKGIDGNPNIYQDTWKIPGVTHHHATRALTGKYATDPDYDKKLNSIIEHYHLDALDHKKMPKINKVLSHTAPVENGDYLPFEEVAPSATAFYPYGKCTWYVYNRLQQFDLHVDTVMGNGGDWAHNALVKGYTVSHTPKAHTAVSFEPGQLHSDSKYGHVAFVEEVKADGSIVISESNVKGLGVISQRVISKADAQQLSYISPERAS
ncbi:flagellum-specific peptidoglycan hydrolase FlgJ [Staphylococcus auricularis]|uniref:glucosaminidase domain-containing protein n=1 Tax=Staphylococcus auricularis TaxID=29379 RepID=UPI001EF33173|nr:glucosaminidase domain-containing protein [Staphylococcus auricularis]